MAVAVAEPLGVHGRGHGGLREDEYEHQYAKESPTPGREVGHGILTSPQELAEPLQFGHEPPGQGGGAAEQSRDQPP